MMNILALGLVLTTLLTAGFFAPSPETQKPPRSEDDVIVKEGHRVVVVEFEKDDATTKILISPQDQGLEKTEIPKEKQSSVRPRELVCDAFGKCKHKISSALEAVAGKSHEAAEAKDAAVETIGHVKDTVAHSAHQVFDKMVDSKEALEESASDAKDTVVEKATDVKHGVEDKAFRTVEETEEELGRAKDAVLGKAKDVKDGVEDKALRTVEETKEELGRAKKKGQKELGDIIRRAREVGADAFGYIFSRVRLAALSGELHLMGFAVAYGMSVWVTFASSHVLAEALSRQQFGMVQSKIYPVYFRAMAYSVGIALIGHLMGRDKSVGSFQGFNLVASLVMILVNLLYLEPQATKVMLERMKKEKEENRGKEGQATEQITESSPEWMGRGGLSAADVGGRQEKAAASKAKVETRRQSDKLQKLNSYSSFLNVLALVSLTWHLAHLGQRLHVNARA